MGKILPLAFRDGRLVLDAHVVLELLHIMFSILRVVGFNDKLPNKKIRHDHILRMLLMTSTQYRMSINEL